MFSVHFQHLLSCTLWPTVNDVQSKRLLMKKQSVNEGLVIRVKGDAVLKRYLNMEHVS